MAGDRADRELLFEALAVSLGFVTRDTVAELGRHHSRDQRPVDGRPLGELLVERAAITAEQCSLVQAVTDELLEQHDGNLGQCLDALSSFGRPRLEREHIGNPVGGSSARPPWRRSPRTASTTSRDPQRDWTNRQQACAMTTHSSPTIAASRPMRSTAGRRRGSGSWGIPHP